MSEVKRFEQLFDCPKEMVAERFKAHGIDPDIVDASSISILYAFLWNLEHTTPIQKQLLAERRHTKKLNKVIGGTIDGIIEKDTEIKALERKLEICVEALQFVTYRQHRFFAECSESESVVNKCTMALEQIKGK